MTSGRIADAFPTILARRGADGFKPVNDTYGHAAGDQVLTEVAARIGRSVPDSPCIARLGGDEFAVLTTGHAGVGEPALIARRILRALEKPFAVDGATIRIGGTIGVAVGPDHGRRVEDLIAAADRAMYDGKREGKNQVRLYAA